jgi:RecA-family ATPase
MSDAAEMFPDNDEGEPVLISRAASEALESWDRTLSKAEHKFKALQFMRAATEVLRLASREASPEQWQQLIDDLHAMGARHGLRVEAVQNLMAAATQALPDRTPGDAAAPLRRTAEPPPVESPADFGLPIDSELDVTGQGAAAPVVPLVFESAASWRGLPLEPMQYLATNRIPAADVTILSGDGGQGKTTIALQLAVAVEQGLGDWLGTTCEQGGAMFFSGEETRHTLRLKLAAICAAGGREPDDLGGLSFYFPEDPLLGILRGDGTIGPTQQMLAFAATVIAARPALVIIDSVAAVFGGNYIDRVQVRTFVSMLRKKVAEAAGCAVLLLDHPSLSGMQNGSGRSGSMDWRNAVRAFMYLRPTDNEDGSKGRELEVMKINSGAPGEIQKLRFEGGCFVLQGTTSAPHQVAAHSTADQAYLECLDAMTAQGRHVCHGKGRGYAPKAFAEMPQANGMTARAFQLAQERLFAAGKIENVPYGPASKGTKCIARKA